MKLTDVQTGDCFIERVEFNLFNFETWLAPFIRFFINLERWFKKKKRCSRNHSGDFEWINGELWVWEARAKGYTKRLASSKFDKLKEKNVDVLRPMFPFNRETWVKAGENMEGKPYDWAGTLFFHLVYQISNKWLRKEVQTNSFFCNSSTGYRYYISTMFTVFKDWYKIDTEDLWKSKLFFKIKQSQ
jgi:hypothetical protein